MCTRRTYEQMILYLSTLLPFPAHVESCTQWAIVSIDLRLYRNVSDLLLLSLTCCILPTTLPRMDDGFKVLQDECFEHPLMACSPQSLTFDWHKRCVKNIETLIISLINYILNPVIDISKCRITGVWDAHDSLSDFGFGRSLWVRQCIDTFEDWAVCWSQHCARMGLTPEQAEARMNEAWETCRMHGGNSVQFHFTCLSVHIVSLVLQRSKGFLFIV